MKGSVTFSIRKPCGNEIEDLGSAVSAKVTKHLVSYILYSCADAIVKVFIFSFLSLSFFSSHLLFVSLPRAPLFLPVFVLNVKQRLPFLTSVLFSL